MEIKCPICSISIEVTQEHIGHKGRCPSCESKFIIPDTPGGEFKILHRGRVPDVVPERKVSLVLPSKGQVTHRRIPARLRLRKSTSPIGMFATAAVCVLAVAGVWMLSDKFTGNPHGTTAATAGSSPGRQSAPAPSPASPQPESPTLPELSPAPARHGIATRPAIKSKPAPMPEVAAPSPAPPHPPALTEEQLARALTFLKSTDPSKRKAGYAGFHNRDDPDRSVYLELLGAARDHHSDTLTDRAWDLASKGKTLTDFMEAHDSWVAARDTAKSMAQTNWKDKDPSNYERQHAEMDAATDKAIQFFAKVNRLAGKDTSAPDAGLQAPADALAEIRAEIAWCEDREPGTRLSLLDEISAAGGADDYVAAIHLVDAVQQTAATLDDAENDNASYSWAGEAYRSFASTLNARRGALGLPPLRLDEQLSKACADHSADMAANGYFSHTGLTPETKTFGTRAKRAGFSGFATGECIFVGSDSASAAHNAWWNSDGHRLIMYADNPNTLGLGLSGKHWTLNTGKR